MRREKESSAHEKRESKAYERREDTKEKGSLGTQKMGGKSKTYNSEKSRSGIVAKRRKNNSIAGF